LQAKITVTFGYGRPYAQGSRGHAEEGHSSRHMWTAVAVRTGRPRAFANVHAASIFRRASFGSFSYPLVTPGRPGTIA
jgi:hypothetical protein